MIFSSRDCVACASCVDACNRGALTLMEDNNGYYFIQRNENLCIECGRCYKVCPVKKIYKNTEKGTSYFACWNTDISLRKKSASGGAFSALASAILKQGGVVYGAAIEEFDVVHKRILTLEELPRILGSKYQQGNLSGIYKKVRVDLLNGKVVLFSGMPCQIAALKSYLGNIDQENLYTVDTICGGFATLLPMRILQETERYSGICSFRDKENGWRSIGFAYSLKMRNKNSGIDDLKLDNLVLNTFSSKLLKKSSCCKCKFTSPYRVSDATIGDFWGDKKFTVQHYNGLSIIAVHSLRIKNLIEESNLQTEKIEIDDFVGYNHNYYWTRYSLVPYFFTRKIALWGLRNRKISVAVRQLRPRSLAGILMSLYLKFVHFFLRKPYLKRIKSLL